ncbi:MAG: cytidine deaminase [Anaerolineales bacterium]|nr:cytidine deaminase [Anaerolineales bacterium]
MMISAAQREALIDAAMQTRERAYVPYSHYQVGAALLGGDGQIYTGVNVENASYGLTICAERTAVVSMVAAGQQRILAVAVATDNAGSPCGACRQVLVEFAGDVPVYLIDKERQVREFTTHELLPEHFGPDKLA